ncbi:laminin subunit beta-3 [Amblyraja radiata]|uniref:laminin subunit beta-3 n=1 Tax=Amblyraja radiata TaxID=386614 RepID=UPI001402CFD8|nr:laminin subunit beta-3 [Amblyraja radiata]
MLLLLLSLAFASRVLAQDCRHHACYPPPRELTTGQGNKLQASSTCGLQKSESYCTAKMQHGRELLQCCVCDSRNEYNPVYFTNSHRIHNVVPSGALRSWWQSENDQDQVSIQLDVGGKLQLHDILLQFKSPRPAAMMIERSNDLGRTWKPYLYLADDCAASFPGVATGRPRDLADVRCQPQLRTQEPSDGQVTFNPLSLADDISASKNDKINSLAAFTNLRINFIKPYKSPTSQNLQNVNTFYAMYELKVRGSCFCNGHASSCAAAGNTIMTPRGPRPTVYGQCICQHHTVGSNCEQCASLYNDQPWRPADDQSTNACKQCNCNNHAQRCHFDAGVHRASGGVSGGVCDGCQHNTMGNNCEKCRPPFRRDPRRDITAIDACVAFACDCESAGSLDGGACDPVTQQCRCKQNVEGARCDRCKSGFHRLLATNPAGCQRCACSEQGSQPGRSCSQTSGQCSCLPHVVGPTCDQCTQGFWNLRSGVGCTACQCHPTNSYSLYCDQVSGQCPCRAGISGRTCGQSDLLKCPDYYYSLGTECVRCKCNAVGSEEGPCNKVTGRCVCRPGFTGQRCDQCERARGYCPDFPKCRQCHPCFLIMDKELSSITVRHKALVNMKLPGLAGGGHDSQILELNNRLRQIQAIISNPAVSNATITDMYNKYIQLRLETDRVNPDIGAVDQNVRLLVEVEELKGDVRDIQAQVRVKKEQVDRYIADGSPGTQGVYSDILASYQRSGRAKDRVTAVEPAILKARDTRLTAKHLESRLSPDNGLKLRQLKEGLKTPDINPLISKVCGGSRGDPCTAARCEGELCPATCAGPDCRGVVQLSRKAIEDAERGSTAVPDISNRIARLSRKLQSTNQLAQQAKDKALSLTYRAVAAKDQMQRNLAGIKSLISQVKDFLTSARADPAEIVRVSEYVLSLRLPTDATTIGDKISTLRDIAARLPDVSEILAHTQHDVDKANALLEEAKTARDRAGEVKDDIGATAGAVRDADTALRKVDEGIGDITEAISSAQDRIQQAEGVLVNTGLSLQDMSRRLSPLAGQISGLALDNKANRQRAGELEQSANDALDTAEEAQQKLQELIPEYEKLRNKVPDSLPKDVMDRVHRVKTEAGFYMNRFTELTQLIETTEQTLASGNQQLEARSARLEDYQNKVVKIKEYIESQARYYSHCTP